MTNLSNCQKQFQQDRVSCELDACYSHLEYFETAFGGDPDSKNVAIFQAKINELQEQLGQLS
jgi:hypothetical protein